VLSVPDDMTDSDLDVPPRRRAASIVATTATFVLGAGAFAWIVTRDDTRPVARPAETAAASEPVFMEVRVPDEPAIPQLARIVDPDAAARHAGILGVVAQESGHFLASPHGGAFAAGDDDEDVWGGLTGSEIGEASGVGGLGLSGTGRGGGGTGLGAIGFGVGSSHGFGARGRWASRPTHDTVSSESYATIEEHDFIGVDDDALSTFSIDVDTASYSNVRDMLLRGMLPPPDAVRIEEMINYFDYDDAPPAGDVPFAVHSEVAPCPWNENNLLVRLGLRGQAFDDADLPTRNFVFLVDVSGSMRDELPLVQQSLDMLVEHMRPQDRVGIVVYAGASGIVLDPTLGTDKAKIRGALARLQSGGSTNGGAGIELAYRLATKHFVEGGANRVILATDGDFNVGVRGTNALDRLIEEKRSSGVFLSVLGYGRGNLQDARMERLADRGDGNYAYIDSAAEARKVLVTEAAGNMVTIAKDVKIQVELDPREVKSWRLVGYENRKLAHADFADDTKDAGEIGAGHSVTALYEIVPARPEAERDGDLMKVALRWKAPQGGKSRATDHVVSSDARSLASTSENFRLAAGAAQLGMLLRDSRHRGTATWKSTLDLVEGVTHDGVSCERAELLRLVGTAARMSGADVAQRSRACTET
jgi:Ca-activated chloride channel family protein